MTPNPTIIQAVEKLGYRVTAGDVSSQVGLNIAAANQGLLALAADAGGHLQVADTGDIVYQFPQNFRDILRNKHFYMRWREWWKKVWGVVFYLIRISFGIFLIISIAVITLTIIIIVTASNTDRDDNDRGSSSRSGGPGVFFFPFPDLLWYFSPNYYETRYQERQYHRQQQTSQQRDLNFFEAVFSFLFGDGNPNSNLEERRWQEIAGAIRHQRGAVVAEQITPYLDHLGESYTQEYEDYMLPVLSRFNGEPQVSPQGQIVYYFPELQVQAVRTLPQPVPTHLEEYPWRFSAASSGQIMLAAGLGVLNFGAALILGGLIADGTAAAQLGGLVAFVEGIYWLLLAYGAGFLGIPLVRYFWIKWRNKKIAARNRHRLERSKLLANPDDTLQEKIHYSQQFASEKIISNEDLVYSTETDLLHQEVQRSPQIEAEWQKRLQEGTGE
ncbi:hypothetical protein [Umezakia ovalisporum]|uniref:Uncharacterized protein n=1 Tax=Umezakia ovalisporum FSS-43 TaxID=2740520 RepID=A0ABT6K8X3_9CYAN|nr:hypothetical protein [Umezakia ovalisporum]MDH6058447.1 hypothetical protein [Umezakia ovalisporum FSS-43]MDH6071669.1 hypothetical protein [Umezakia ovalisporum CobakiLakeA]MDH6073232.1 hypothetical protein [Umezakia ovalisporum CS-1034]MDH6076460.1 hypothetical protein [Umezakia ovalisporum FSS-45]MDH6080416.1 hypothetical protein [Umezakia ovalisporum FSS-44]